MGWGARARGLQQSGAVLSVPLQVVVGFLPLATVTVDLDVFLAQPRGRFIGSLEVVSGEFCSSSLSLPLGHEGHEVHLAGTPWRH